MEEQTQPTFTEYLEDYPSLLKGLTKLKMITPTDFQQQLLEVDTPIDNLIVSAPPESGKTIALILNSLKKFINEEEGVLLFLSHSKDLSQTLSYLISSLSKIPSVNLFMQELKELGPKEILIGSPLQVNNLNKQIKDMISSVIIIEADYLFGYGYGQALHLLAGSLSPKVTYKVSCIQKNIEIQSFKTAFMKKVVKIDYVLPQSEIQSNKIKEEKLEGQVTHFFGVGDRVMLPINVYVTLKFGLVNPKILILVQNLRDIYRYQLFLERCRISGVGIYNHENPINLKFYVISTWMTGPTNILIATKQIITDLSSNVFKQNSKKAYKREHFDLVNMTTIISVNLKHLNSEYSSLFDLFQTKPFILTFVENTETEIQHLQQLIKYENKSFGHVVTKELPITKKELEGFRYRINDVWMSLGNFKVDQFQQIDFKKKMLKSPDLKEYFEQNVKQRTVLVKSINDLRKKIDFGKVTISELVPDYLVPQCLKAAYQEKVKLIKKNTVDQSPLNYQKVNRVMKYVDVETEDPEITDVSRLKLVSARKRWKLNHGFKLKKRNERNEKKGIFEGNS